MRTIHLVLTGVKLLTLVINEGKGSAILVAITECAKEIARVTTGMFSVFNANEKNIGISLKTALF